MKKLSEELRPLLAAARLGTTTPDAKALTRRLDDAKEKLRCAEADIANFTPNVDVAALGRERDALNAEVAELK